MNEDPTRVGAATVSNSAKHAEGHTPFEWSLLGLGLLFIMLSVIAYSQPVLWSVGLPPNVYAAILAASLGIMGALTFVLYAAIGEIEDPSVNVHDHYKTLVRLFLGGAAGWALFFISAQSAFTGESGNRWT